MSHPSLGCSCFLLLVDDAEAAGGAIATVEAFFAQIQEQLYSALAKKEQGS